MTANERLMLIILLCAGIILGWMKGSSYNDKARNMQQQISQIEPKKEKLHELSIVYNKWKKAKEFYHVRNASFSLKDYLYNLAKICNLRVLSVVPFKESMLYGLQKEGVSLNVEGSYDDLMLFIKKMEDNPDVFLYVKDITINTRKDYRNGKIIYNIAIEVDCIRSVDSQK